MEVARKTRNRIGREIRLTRGEYFQEGTVTFDVSRFIRSARYSSEEVEEDPVSSLICGIDSRFSLKNEALKKDFISECKQFHILVLNESFKKIVSRNIRRKNCKSFSRYVH